MKTVLLVLALGAASLVAADGESELEGNTTSPNGIPVLRDRHAEEEAPSDRVVLIMTFTALGLLLVLSCLFYGLYKYQTFRPARKAKKYELSFRGSSVGASGEILTAKLRSVDAGAEKARSVKLPQPDVDGMVEIQIDDEDPPS